MKRKKPKKPAGPSVPPETQDLDPILEEAVAEASGAVPDFGSDTAGVSLALIPEIVEPGGSGERRGDRALARMAPLAKYLAELRNYPQLEREEELELARIYKKTGDRDAGARLVTANLILVVRIARLFRSAVANALDLVQEGNIGLLQALDRFDPEVGVRFSTYAGWWIKAYILKFLLDNARMVRVGTTNARRRLLYNLQREKRNLEEAGFTVGPKLLAEKFGVSERDVVEIQQTLTGGDVSLDAPLNEDGDSTRGDLVPAGGPSVEDQVAEGELKQMLETRIASFRKDLSARDAELLDRRLLADEPATLQEIGTSLGITREAVRQAEKRLIGRLKAYLSKELGEDAILHFKPRR